MARFPGADLIVRVQPDAIFPNCPRYLHKMQLVEMSAYVPQKDKPAPVPNWKLRPEFNEVLPRGDSARAPTTGKKD
jgi:hypothetical protein